MVIRLKALGGFRVLAGEVEVTGMAAQPIRSALLVYLAMERSVSRDQLLGVFWPEHDSASARHALNQNLHRLRKTLPGTWLGTEGERVEITDELEIDALAFEKMAEQGDTTAALTLYRGHFLDGWYLGQTAEFESWVDRCRSRLERVHRVVRREHLRMLRSRNQLREALAVAQGWADLDPLEDEAQHSLIELLAKSGRRNEALTQFRSYRELLDRDGLEPLQETLDLVREIQEGGGAIGELLQAPVASHGQPPEAPPEPQALRPRPSRFRSYSMAILSVLALGVAGILRFPEYVGLGRDPDFAYLRDGHRIVLADFGNDTPDSTLAVVATEALRIDLNSGLQGSLLEPTEVSAVLRRMGRAPGPILEPEVAREVAIRAGAELVIEGQVGSVGSASFLSAKVRRAESGRVLGAFRQVAQDQTGIIEALEGLSRDLRRSLSPFPGDAGDRAPLPSVTTTSLDALRAYAQAMRVWDFRADGPTALTLLEEAVAVDSTFAMAFRKMGTILVTLQLNRERQIWALEKAYRNREHLSDIERLLTSATYHQAITGDLQAASAALTALLELDADNLGAMANLASILEARGDIAEAERLLRRCVGSQEPMPLCWFLLAGNLYSQDRATEAWQVLLDAENRYSGNWQVEEMQVYWLTAQGRYREADSILDGAGPGGDPRLQGARLRARAGIAAVRGRLREAREHLAHALRVLETAGLAEPFCWVGLTDALVLMELRRDTAQALRIADGIVSHPLLAGLEPMDRPYLPLAQFYALAGSRERASALIQEFLSLVPEYARGPFDSSLFHVRGILASQQGRFREAREAFLAAATRTTRIRTLYYQALLHEFAQEPDSALLAYRAFLEVPDIRRFDLDQFLLGPVLARIAEIQIAHGNPDAATLTLDRLSSLWQDADHELTALVADIRRQTLQHPH